IMKIWPSIIILFIFVTSLIFLAFTDDVSNAMQNLYCDLGLKSEELCPIDGEWSSWSPWGSCSGKCGFKGKKIRHRICNNPIPSNNGAPCIGPNYQIESCHITGCTMNDYEKIVNIHPIRKEELEIVKDIHQKLPALIELCFLADCTFFIVEKILGNNSMLYWNAMNCIKYNVGCPNPGGWSAWGIWSPCTAICGKGLKYRTRICNSPIPSNYKLVCHDSAFETKNCLGLNCRKLSMGTWTNWSKWTICSVECGSGIRTRKRACSEIQNLQGTSCKGVSKEIKGCTINNCSINGMWSSWTIWSSCTSSCGIGTQLRNRMCNNPSPNGNGTSCFGSASEIRQCFTKPCIVKSHEIADFTEESYLFYETTGRPSRLLHIYLRFLPLSPFGMIIYRFEKNCKGLICDFVKLFLQNGKIVLLSQIADCTLALIHETKMEIGQWHVVLIAIYGTHGILRIDDGLHKINTFSCIPMSYDLDHVMKIGGFQGQIQEIAINFAPIQLRALKVIYI
ncbi:coadhesin-like, partial [Apis laboriosa]|uniref:coadhesin-like n=1 Tax=Apis laboriosa TaxID=183418 RepID=UPI001CC7D9CE